MELKECDFESIKEIPLNFRVTLAELMKHLKIIYSNKINKMIENNTILAYRNGVISAFTVIQQELEKDKPQVNTASVLTRKRIEAKGKKEEQN